MQLSSSSSFVDRVIGAIRLDPATYEEVEHDTDATWQAAVVVAVAAIFSGVGSSGGNTQGLVGGVLAAVSLLGDLRSVRVSRRRVPSEGAADVGDVRRGVASPRLLLLTVAYSDPGTHPWYRVPVHIHRRDLVACRERHRIAPSARGEHRPRGRRRSRGVPGDVRHRGGHRGCIGHQHCGDGSPDAPGVIS